MIRHGCPCASVWRCMASSATARLSWPRQQRTLEPQEPEYEQAYQEAARAHRIYGWEIPYADAGDEAEESPHG